MGEEQQLMDEMLQEYVNSRGVDMRVDLGASVIRGVKLLGLSSRNKRRYLPAALAQAAALYEGAKVNVNHPKGNPLAARDYQDRLGAIRNVAVREGQGLFGDLHFNPKHALAEQLLWDATHAPENVGLSHNVEARTSHSGGKTVVEAILKVQSVDLVADPATTRGLYESKAGNTADGNGAELLAAITLEELRAARPDLFDAIAAASAARLNVLEAEVDQLRAAAALRERRDVAVRLLNEFSLPDPDQADVAARPLVSEQFMQSVLAAPDEAAMRSLVEERAALLAAARKLEPIADVRPRSREQYRSEPDRPRDARSFARAIL
jgi:hypothetical protein